MRTGALLIGERRHDPGVTVTELLSDLTVATDPAEVGFDAARLQRLDRRLAQWVDQGHLPGFLVTVARHGKLVHVGKHGHRDVEAGRPGTDDTRRGVSSLNKTGAPGGGAVPVE